MALLYQAKFFLGQEAYETITNLYQNRDKKALWSAPPARLNISKNAKKILEVTSPNGLDVSRSLKDRNNDISLLKLNELQMSLSAE